jgi:hypothetical protein
LDLHLNSAADGVVPQHLRFRNTERVVADRREDRVEGPHWIFNRAKTM